MTVKRLSEKPFRITFDIVETGANTFTQEAISIPIAPAIRAGGSKLQAIELMKLFQEVDFPSFEEGENNRTEFSFSNDDRSAMAGFESSRTINHEDIHTDSNAINGALSNNNHIPTRDVTDGDGNGQLFTLPKMFVSIKGTGNSGVRRLRGYWLCHLVEIDAEDVVVNAALAPQN